MREIELLFDQAIYQLTLQLQQWGMTHTVYGFAAVLVVYIWIIFRRAEAGR